ncbi:hypothetical protein HanRHA438_Chr16g0785751 [Helianthus annuus]|nr:hypothetical protein HanRHA438_Chr16g0785751 [Helianthus annuus]
MSSYQACPESNTPHARQALRILYKVNVKLPSYLCLCFVLKTSWSRLYFVRLS